MEWVDVVGVDVVGVDGRCGWVGVVGTIGVGVVYRWW